MKVLLALMNNAESMAMARPLLRAIASAGGDIILLHPWSSDYFPVEDLIEFNARYFTLSDGGFDTIPRLSRQQYETLCGDDLDFLSCQYHNLALRGFPPSREFLYQDSMYHQWHHGLAYRAGTILQSLSPDYVLIQQGSEPVSKILYGKAASLGYPVALLETPFVGGKLLIDSVGMHFFPEQHRIERDWPAVSVKPLADGQKSALQRYLDQWRNSGSSKYPQVEDAAERKDLEVFLKGCKHVLFVADQVPWDASIINSAGAFQSLDAMVRKVKASLPPGWRAVYKLHPKNPLSAKEPLGQALDTFFVARNLSIHRLIQRSDAVLTFSSNVGLESLVYGKPVLTGGKPHYAGRGLTLDLEHPEDFEPMLEKALSFQPDPSTRDRYLHHVLFDYLIDETDTAAILRRLQESLRPLGQYSQDPRQPFSRHYLEDFHEFQKQVERYQSLAQANFCHHEIVPSDSGPLRPPLLPAARLDASDGSALDSGERQVAFDLEKVAPNHRIRYRLACEFVRPGQQVLDFTCGVGYGSFMLASQAPASVLGVDASNDAIAFARDSWAAGNIDYVEASAGGFQFPEEAFDSIVSYETIEHLHDDRGFVLRLWHALRPGGTLWLSVPHGNEYPIKTQPFHVRHYSERSLRGLLQGLPGLDLLRVLGQVEDCRIENRAAGRHLLALAHKNGGDLNAAEIQKSLDRLLPFQQCDLDPERLPQRRLRFRPGQFQYPWAPRGQPTTLGAALPLDGRQGFLLYGPYARLAPGSYLAGFLIGLDESQPQPIGQDSDSGLILDVAGEAGRVLASQVLRAPSLDQLRAGRRLVVLPFELERGMAVEFRAALGSGLSSGVLNFFGVEVRERRSVMENRDSAPDGDPFQQSLVVLDVARQEQEARDAELAEFQRQRDEFARQRQAWQAAFDFFEKSREDWERQRDQFARQRAEWEAQQAMIHGEMETLQENLAPYRVLDRLGVIRSGYGWARKIKRRLVS